MHRYKKAKKTVCVLFAGMMLLSICGCGRYSAKDIAPNINLEPYSKNVYETTTVQQGDIESILTLTLKPDDFENKNYSIKQSDYEVESVNIKKGDKVKAGDVMISFKADEIQETIDSYVEEKAQNEMLIDHYTKLMAIDSSEDYTDDIASLRDDIELANLYIEEQNERLKEYQVIAERDGTVTYLSDSVQYGYATADETLVTIVSGSSDYTVTTDDGYKFKVGDEYSAEFGIATYKMKVKSCEKYVDDATDKEMQTIIFEPLDDMSGVTESDVLTMTINKPVIHDVVYVNKAAVFEGSDENNYVYVVDDDGNRKAVQVKTGGEVDELIIITEGLKAGEQVTIN